MLMIVCIASALIVYDWLAYLVLMILGKDSGAKVRWRISPAVFFLPGQELTYPTKIYLGPHRGGGGTKDPPPTPYDFQNKQDHTNPKYRGHISCTGVQSM